ncbi:MAG: hypothetical protein JNL39_03415 [Opitutaceae bacterium]|nr:hypothetical protein [Opitutaceae bacterium]
MKRLAVRLGAPAVLFLALAAWHARERPAISPNPVTFDLVLEPGEAGRADPLIVSGRTGAGDFLTVRFDDARTVRFVYDSWGIPGIESTPLPIEPGVPVRLTVEMPGLSHVPGQLNLPRDHVRVVARGAVVLDTPVHAYPRRPDELYFGENPLGGTACGPRLRGRMTVPEGGSLTSRVGTAPPLHRRIAEWAGHFPQQAAVLALLCLAAAFGATWLRRAPAAAAHAGRILARHRWFTGAATIATLGYLWLVTQGTWRLHEPEWFGDFYDYQAASLLSGRLDVPEAAIGGEAFEARGKLYGYFGPTPALLRAPLVALGLGFGHLSRGFMLGFFVATLVAAYLLLREAQRWLRPGADDADAPPSPFATLVIVASVGWGSTVLFLGTRAIVFHEAILSGIAFALWSAWCALRHLRAPPGRWWIGALVCGVASVHCRPPTGLFALTLLGCVAVVAWLHSGAARWTAPALRRAALIGGLCVAGQLSLNGLAWLKFRTFDPAPLAISRPYRDPARLERIDGKSFHAANIPFGFYTYFVRANLRLEPGFPWIYWHAREPGREFPRAKLDLPDHTVATPWAMPSLVVLATLGAAAAALGWRRARPAVAVLWLAALPMSLALFAAVATAQRYTGDFCPWLIAGAAFGLAALDSLAGGWRASVRAVVAALTLAAIAVTGALTLNYQGDYLWGVSEETRARYQVLRTEIDAFFGAPKPPTPARPAADAAR